MKIGIFGGAFNPVHNGHLHLAACYVDALALDKMLFIPTAVSPHKSSAHLISGVHRINMLKLAFSGNDKYVVSDIEFKRSGKSYTYDTIRVLKKMYPHDELFLIVGSDQYLYFQNWYRADEILNEVTLCTACREADELKKLTQFRDEYANLKNSIISTFDAVIVSSSQIRDSVHNAEDISDFVPEKVENYIREHKLYV